MQYQAIIGLKKNKIPAADAAPGVIIMLAYYAGGHNLFPSSIDVPDYLLEIGMKEGAIRTDAQLLDRLLSSVSAEIKTDMGQLQIGCLPVYLSALRNGYRANRNGKFPAVRVHYESKIKELTIYPRSYQADRVSRVAELIPSWIQLIKRTSSSAVEE